MKKLLNLVSVLAFSTIATTNVVACNQQQSVKTPSDLNGKSFNVKLGSFTSEDGQTYSKGADQWGINSIGALYASLWSINNKPAQKHDDDTSQDFHFQNADVAAYLTKGESYVRLLADDGSDVTFTSKDGDPISESTRHETDGKDWHEDVLTVGDKVDFQYVVHTYKKGDQGPIVDKEFTGKIALTIVA